MSAESNTEVEIQEERLSKVALLRAAGYEPYAARTARDMAVSDFITHFTDLELSGEAHTIAGRVMSKRGHGALVFVDLYDGTSLPDGQVGRVQVLVRTDELGEQKHTLFVDTVDTGDFVEFTGTAMTTQRGEQSLLAADWRMLTKSITPLPKEHFGIKDEDERYRKRYLGILLDEELRTLPALRSMFWNTIRSFLLERGYIEVETPVLENTTGGAEAAPFATHHNALDVDMYLRISPELWHKRLMVAGVPKVFEIGRIFRNEGMSAEHLQDYTQVEFYEAYADFRVGMTMIQELYRRIAHDVFGTGSFTIKGYEIDMDAEWQEYNLSEIIRTRFGIDPLETTAEEVQAKLSELGIAFDPMTTEVGRGVDLLWKSIRKEYAGPGFLVGVPKYLEPLAKVSADDPRVVERFQVILAGSEMGKGFSELNDPIDQRERFAAQQALRDAGDDEAQMADDTFVEALEYGMPPTFGFGVSERLFSFLMDKSVRETSLFPLMRPKS